MKSKYPEASIVPTGSSDGLEKMRQGECDAAVGAARVGGRAGGGERGRGTSSRIRLLLLPSAVAVTTASSSSSALQCEDLDVTACDDRHTSWTRGPSSKGTSSEPNVV